MNIFEAHAKCYEDVEEQEYYTHIFNLTKSKFGFVVTESNIKAFWNDFWYTLPDSPSIHRHPFSLICEICEGEFDE